MFATNEMLILPETLELQQMGLMVGLDESRSLGISGKSGLSQLLASPEVASLLENTNEKIEVYRGRSITKRFGIGVKGSGAKAKGRITGTFKGYDYRAAYQVYNLPTTQSAKYWFITYSKTSSTSELKKTFENSETTDLKYDISFELQGNDFGITSVYIYYEVIRLKLNGQTKDYVVTNPQSSGAVSPDGSPYPGGFTPIEQQGG